jgi:hypothetical protein
MSGESKKSIDVIGKALCPRCIDLDMQLRAAKAAAVQWVTYDGSPETLPEPGRVIVVTQARYAPEYRCFAFLDNFSEVFFYRGDRWAYLPTPPQADPA